MYTFRFWFEHGGGCLWSANDAARKQYGYKVNYTVLPISEQLQTTLSVLETAYRTILNWDDPAAGHQWTSEQTAAFLQQARQAYDALCEALGENFTVLDELDACI